MAINCSNKRDGKAIRDKEGIKIKRYKGSEERYYFARHP
jgi:hypothetical protein